MFYRKRGSHLPGWLFFFLAFPIGLVVTLLYRKNRLPLVRQPARRYTEPDSIPIDPHSAAAPYSEIPPGAPEAEVVLDSAPEVTIPDAQPATRAGRSPSVGVDDLKIIEGIGPAIARLLNENGITTLAQLADTSPSRLNEILTGAGLNRLADPATWPDQAALGAAGKWDELQQLQGTLKGGRRKNS